jgi:hypothetical protein
LLAIERFRSTAVRQGKRLTIVCEPCSRRGHYAVARLMEQHGDAKLTDLLWMLADCHKAHSASIHDRCKAVYGKPGG